MAKRKSRGLGDISALRCGGTVTLRREPLNRGGYTSQGRYFGAGEKLWSFSTGESWGYLRASDKAAAKRKILAKCPAIGFDGAKRKRRR